MNRLLLISALVLAAQAQPATAQNESRELVSTVAKRAINLARGIGAAANGGLRLYHPARCMYMAPTNNAADELCNQAQCTESFPLLEDGVKRRKPAPSRLPCTGTGLSASYGSLSRAAAMTHSAVRGGVAGLLDRESPSATAHHFSETFGIKDFFHESLISP